MFEDEADSVVENCVLVPNEIVVLTVLGGFVVWVVEFLVVLAFLEAVAGRLGAKPFTTNVAPLMEITWPLANLRFSARKRLADEPLRRKAPPGKLPAGKLRPANWLFPGPGPLDVPLAEKRGVQEPAVDGLRDTVVALTGPVFAVLDETMVTQSPMANCLAAIVTVWLNRVEEVQETVTWPVDGSCTSIEEPEIAATVPEAVEKAGRGGAVVVVGVFFFVAPPATSTEPVRTPTRTSAVSAQRSVMNVLMISSKANLGRSATRRSFGSEGVDRGQACRPACRIDAKGESDADRHYDRSDRRDR